MCYTYVAQYSRSRESTCPLGCVVQNGLHPFCQGITPLRPTGHLHSAQHLILQLSGLHALPLWPWNIIIMLWGFFKLRLSKRVCLSPARWCFHSMMWEYLSHTLDRTWVAWACKASGTGGLCRAEGTKSVYSLIYIVSQSQLSPERLSGFFSTRPNWSLWKRRQEQTEMALSYSTA